MEKRSSAAHRDPERSEEDPAAPGPTAAKEFLSGLLEARTGTIPAPAIRGKPTLTGLSQVRQVSPQVTVGHFESQYSFSWTPSRTFKMVRQRASAGVWADAQ